MSRTPPLVVGTVVSTSHLPRLAVMVRSLRRQHPGAAVWALNVDGWPVGWRRDGVEPLTWASLGLSPEEWQRRATIYGVRELCSSLKPEVMLHVLRHTETALYLDADCQIFARLDGLISACRRGVVALTPHLLRGEGIEGSPYAKAIRRSGVFNMGALSLGPRAQPFLEWWRDRLRWSCIDEPSEELMADQRWVDLAPSLFDVEVVDDPTVNVAYWNLHERPLRGEGPFFIDDAPLSLFHFSGYDETQRWRCSGYALPPEQAPDSSLAHRPSLRALFDQYAAQLAEEGEPVAPVRGWYTLANGALLTLPIRRAIRRSWLEHPRAPEELRVFDDPLAADRTLAALPKSAGPRALAVPGRLLPHGLTFVDCTGGADDVLADRWRRAVERSGAPYVELSDTPQPIGFNVALVLGPYEQALALVHQLRQLDPKTLCIWAGHEVEARGMFDVAYPSLPRWSRDTGWTPGVPSFASSLSAPTERWGAVVGGDPRLFTRLEVLCAWAADMPVELALWVPHGVDPWVGEALRYWTRDNHRAQVLEARDVTYAHFAASLGVRVALDTTPEACIDVVDARAAGQPLVIAGDHPGAGHGRLSGDLVVNDLSAEGLRNALSQMAATAAPRRELARRLHTTLGDPFSVDHAARTLAALALHGHATFPWEGP